MQIDHVEIDWCDHVDNAPHINVHMDEDVWSGGLRRDDKFKAYPLDENRGTLLVSVHENGVVRWVLDRSEQESDRSRESRGAMTGDYPMEDGTTRTVTSGWSSRGEVVSEITGLQIADVSFYGPGRSVGMGGGTGLLVEVLEQHLPEGVVLGIGEHTLVSPKWAKAPTKAEWRTMEKGRITKVRAEIASDLGLPTAKRVTMADELEKMRQHPRWGECEIRPYADLKQD